MPIPTDTYWNIKRLNVVFALSSVALVGVMLWSVLQDYDKAWRNDQKAAVAWEAALVSEKLARALGPDEKMKLADVDRQLAAAEVRLQSEKDEIARTEAAVRDRHDRYITPLEIKHNDRKSNVAVAEARYEQARAAGDAAAANDWAAKLTARDGDYSRAALQQEDEQLWKW